MRVFKKIMYIILAVVPILPIVLFGITNIGNAQGVDIMSFGNFSAFREDDLGEGYYSHTSYVLVEKDTILSYIVEGMIPTNRYVVSGEIELNADDESSNEFMLVSGLPEGFYDFYVINETELTYARIVNNIVDLYQWFNIHGIAPSSYVVFIFAYLSYLTFVYIAFMLFDFITFVPRKISEMLEGRS